MSYRKGFTLIELLVVIAIIALLLSILMPSLSIAKQKAQGVVCLSNLNNLSKAWYAYSIENNGKIVGGATPPNATTKWGGAGNHTVSGWVFSPQSESGKNPLGGSEIKEKIIGIKRGALYPFLESPKVYHCPGDKRMNKLPAEIGYSSKGFYGKGGYRSYSISGGMNGVNPNGNWSIIPITKHSQIRTADSKFVFLEEMDGRGFNRGSWVIRPDTMIWVDPIAIWHNNASTIGFADGHAEPKKWHGNGTREMAEKQTSAYVPESEKDKEDFRFIQRIYPYLKLFP